MFMITKTVNGTQSYMPVSSFLCDTRDDITSLPTHTKSTEEFPDNVYAGSTALVTADSSVWMLNNADEWVEL